MRLLALVAFSLLATGCESIIVESYSHAPGRFEYSRMPGREALEAAAADGDLDAQYKVVLFRSGSIDDYGTDSDVTLRTLESLAAQGHAGAARSLAGFYRDGRGVEADYETSLDWTRRAAALGDKQAARMVTRDMAAHRAWQRAQQSMSDAARAVGQ